VPRLIVIKGADEGRQFPLDADLLAAGRDSTSKIRLTDTEVSRRHVEFTRTPEGYRLRDVGSANGTYVNNQSIQDVLLRPGDHVQIGQTVLVYTLERGEQAPPEDLASKISLITRQDFEVASAIVKTVSDSEGSRILTHPDRLEGPPAKTAQILAVLYEAIQTVSQTLDLEPLLNRLMELIFRTIQADRGCILLRSASPLQEGYGMGADPGPISMREFEPRVVRWRDPMQAGQVVPVSRTIIDHVLQQKQGILVNDAQRDERFQAVQSIVRNSIREVICVPMRGRHQTLGVLYLDTSTPAIKLAAGGQTGKFTGDHLTLAIAMAHQAALAVENTRYYQAMVNAERLAAVGQTVAALSHHIKNILQGLMLGSDLLENGLKDKDETASMKGWQIVRKNQAKVHQLVMDMLTYSKEREPDICPTDLNSIVRDVVELMQPRAEERGITLGTRFDETLPLVPADPESMHRCLLNIVSNAFDAVQGRANAQVTLTTSREPLGGVVKEPFARIQVTDNGNGIDAEMLQDIFKPFVSTKGAKGTGLGLAVSRKMMREQGGDITVVSEIGKGSIFTLRVPLRNPFGQDPSSTRTEMPVAPF
jgi:signal transduction histidine kinase